MNVIKSEMTHVIYCRSVQQQQHTQGMTQLFTMQQACM